MRRLLFSLLLFIGFCGAAYAAPTSDPCMVGQRQSAAISVSTATTKSLVAVSGTTSVYVCSFSISIAGSATTAATAAFEYGTGASCSSPTVLTGTYGSNDAAVSTTPTVIPHDGGGYTLFAAPSGNGLCIVTTGNAVFTQGVLTFVQQ
jgi:hypothetical protein